MADPTTPTPAGRVSRRRIPARLRGPCLPALSKTTGFAGGALSVRRPASTIRGHPNAAAMESTI
jgi:hypothetical protein